MKRLLAGCAGMAALSFAMLSPAAAQTVAITNAKLVIGDGSKPIDGGTVVVRNGRVVAAGAGVAVPAGMETVDAQGKYVTPGIVAGFTRLGIVEVEGVDTVNDAQANDTPFNAALDVAPAVNPNSTTIPVNRAEGVTRAVVAPGTSGSIFGGQGAIIDLGADFDALTKRRAFQYMEFGEEGMSDAGGSRPAAYAMLRNALVQARDYAANPGAYGDLGKDALLTRYDAQALVPVTTGEMTLLAHVERASDIMTLLDLKREIPNLKLVLVGVTEGWLVAPQIAAAGVAVIASALNDLPASFEQLAATQSNIGRMKAAGVKVGIGTIDDDDFRQARRSKYYAGNLVALNKVPGATGLSWDDAFAALTSRPAEAFGMGAEIGSLKPGTRGDIVIWSGDPLEYATKVEAVWIDGVKQPLATRQDALLQRYYNPGQGDKPDAYTP